MLNRNAILSSFLGILLSSSACFGQAIIFTQPSSTSPQPVPTSPDSPYYPQFSSVAGRDPGYAGSVVQGTVASSPTDAVCLLGSATKVVRVTQIRISGDLTVALVATAGLNFYSTADTGGTSGAVTVTPFDQSDVAAGASLLLYSANPTAGTLAGVLKDDLISFGALSGSAANVVSYDFIRQGKPPTLRGATESLCLNLGGVALSGMKLNASFEWTETAK